MNTLLYNISILLLSFQVSLSDSQFDPDVEQAFPDLQFDLTEELSHLTDTEETVDSLVSTSSELRGSDIREAYKAGRLALVLAEQLNYREGKSGAHITLGNIYSNFGDYEVALEHYLIATEIEEDLDNREAIASLLNNKGLIFIEQQDYEKAFENLMKALDIRRELGQEDDLYLAKNNLGVVHRRQGNYNQALEYFRAAEYESMELAGDTLVHMIATLNIGNTLRNKKNLTDSEPYIRKAAQYFEEIGHINFQSASNLVLGQLMRDRGDYDSALNYAHQSLELGLRDQLRERIKDAYELLADLYHLLEDFESAYQYLQAYNDMYDELLQIQRSNLIYEMQIRFDIERMNQELEFMEQEAALREARISQERWWRNFLMLGIAGLVVISLLLYYLNRQKKKSNRLLKQRRYQIEEQNDQLVKLNQEKDELMSFVAHDLRNPLSVIQSASDLMKHGGEVDPNEVKEYSEMIQVSTSRMMRMLNNILDIQNSDLEVANEEMHPVAVDKSVKQSIQHFQQTALTKNIDLKPDLPGCSVNVLANKDKLIRVLDNLLSNAIKFSPDGSEVSLSCEQKDDHVRISVIDNGPGLSEEDQNRLFQKFTPLSNSPTGREKSTGLGLYIVKQLTESMGGTVSCESEPGKGAVFTVELVRAGRPVLETPAQKPSEADNP